MARNNKNRTLDASAPDTPVDNNTDTNQIEQNNNTTFSFPLPTEVVDLPSKGAFYGPNSTLHGKTEIEIKYMTAKEEDILTSVSLAKKGLTIDRLLQSIMIDKTIKTSDMLVGDRNALLMAARITGYGPEYEAGIKCNNCGHQFAEEIDLGSIGHKTPKDDTKMSIRNGVGYIHLPVANIEIGIRPITVADEKRMEQVTAKRRKHKLEDTALTDMLRAIIVSAAGVEDRGEISNLIEVLPARDSRVIRKEYKNIAPDLDLSINVECPECDHEEVREVPIDAGFFWPDE
tara:strand:+ start:545 stop:1408 length:864 start_codon:yes stop_codon:yes gene_type:complete